MAHSYPPDKGLEISIGASGCVARLIRRTSKSTRCFPANGGTPASGHGFGCENNASVVMHGRCTGLFQCGNGAVTMCGNAKEACNCTGEPGRRSPCHLNPYMRKSNCPPAMPFPPFPPPKPPAPPSSPPHPRPLGALGLPQPREVATCEPWCAAANVTHEYTSWCKCASCKPVGTELDPLETHRVREGAKCRSGRKPVSN